MNPDLTCRDARPLVWADAFPWLAGASGSNDVNWWQEEIVDADPLTYRSRLATISELAMERLTRWTIGQIFPGLPPNIDLMQLPLPTRAVNALARFGGGSCAAGQLITITLDEMLDWSGVGIGTVDSILQELAELSTSLATPTVTSRRESQSPSDAIPHEPTQLPEWTVSIVDDLNHLAMWFVTVGLPTQRLISGDVPPGTPDEIMQARARLESLTPQAVLPAQLLHHDVSELFDDALRQLEPRAVEVLGSRLFADEPMTLDQLGLIHGVTRERIRQIEGKARGTMLSLISDTGPLEQVADRARALIGTIRPLDDLLQLIPALRRVVACVGQPAWRVLDRLDDAYEIEDGWCAVPTMNAARELTQTQLSERSDKHGVIRLDEIDIIKASNAEIRPALTAEWLSHCGYVTHGDFVLTRTSSVGDYAAAILSIEGAPLSAQQIIDRFIYERSVGSLRNAMGIDDRFERVDRDSWALKEWGMEAYGGIRSVIRELVGRGGGRARLNDVVEYITARYSVSSSSVIAYAGAAPFITIDGVVQLDSGDRSARKAPENTRRMFRRPDGWAYRVKVTTDHLRGSGTVAPLAVAAVTSLKAGQSIQLESRLGPQSISWTGIQPAFGTIRRFLMEADVATGTEVFLIINDNQTFGFECAPELGGNPLTDALSLVASPAPRDSEEARVALARAIKLPDDSPVSSIIGGYRSRGDDEVADLILAARENLETGQLPATRTESADVDDIMGLL
ncbi:sigma factor-like helix-turn-helix DNA-binding protein [Dietzia sp. KRD202]|uniref:sigma factor-like helix-turn-helix DNA-binding protein n=1 Tax=Dietzia sp. KRD202 TaxID=2729732 RepID=UPI0019CFF9BD|nr:sigma factor-like helix-turn-helix DNA-binding protein [Dietzia sp. KRD202]